LISDCDTDIEQWHASQVGGVFRNVYGRQLVIRARRAGSSDVANSYASSASGRLDRG
jgi:hypothetical protein